MNGQVFAEGNGAPLRGGAGRTPGSAAAGLLKKAGPFLVIAALIALVFGRTMTYDFTGFDEYGLVVENRAVMADMRSAGEIFFKPLFARFNTIYRPVFMASLVADFRAGGTSPAAYHCSNLLYHFIAVSLLYLLFLALRFGRRRSLFAALVFAVHPLVTSAVSWVPGRNDALLGIGAFGSFLFLCRYLERRTPGKLAAHLLFLSMALFTKETAAVLPPVFLLYYFLAARQKAADAIPLLAGWLAALGAWALLRSLGTVPVPLSFPAAFSWLVKGGPALLWYLGQAVFPASHSVFPAPGGMPVLAGLAAALALAAAGAALRPPRAGLAAFSLAWFPALLLPTFIIIGDEAVYYSHRAYVPLAGILLFCLAVSEALPPRGALKKAAAAAAALVLLAFGAGSSRYRAAYADAGAYWSRALAEAPGSLTVLNNSGQVLAGQKKYDEALRVFRKALALAPGDAKAYNNLGTLYSGRGEYRRAVEAYGQAVSLDPGFAMAYYNRGNVFFALGRYDDAVAEYRRALAAGGDDPDVRYNIGAAFYRSGRFGEAAGEFRKAAAQDPSSASSLRAVIESCERRAAGGRAGEEKGPRALPD